MLRLETETGWSLVTHMDHARLAGDFAAAWGNREFASPVPREKALLGIRCHDDGWAARDAHPQITRQGKPSAFSTELVGKYSAFEEIDLEDYLAVRDRAVRMIAEDDAYAGLLISLHTYNLLTERADRSTIASHDLPRLDTFLERQLAFQKELLAKIRADRSLAEEETSDVRIRDHFRLLQATDNLSLLSCVGFMHAATLLHPLPLTEGRYSEIQVRPTGLRSFELHPYPFGSPRLIFEFPARHIDGRRFETSEEFARKYVEAPVERLSVVVAAAGR